MTEIEKAKKIAEITRKIESAKRDLDGKKGYLESDIRFKRDTTNSASDVKYATRRLESLQRELDSLL